ncbi:MAG: alpha/beta hydrolase [Thermoplasmata archaeon]|nr:alpha/beta hydrolase [Thermoplasmata archaeon]
MTLPCTSNLPMRAMPSRLMISNMRGLSGGWLLTLLGRDHQASCFLSMTRDCGCMFAELPGVKLYYEEEGEGEPVILIGGIGANHRFWKGMVPLLKGCRVITMDNRGVGMTEYEKEEIRIDEIADDVIHLMDHLHIYKAHIVGWSMGSEAAMSIAVRHPQRVQTLTLVSSFQYRPYRSAYFMQNTTRLAKEGVCTAEAIHIVITSFCFPETFFAGLAEKGMDVPTPKRFEDPTKLLEQMKAMDTFDIGDRIDEIKVPTLVVHGAEDIMVEPKKAHAVRDAIKGSVYLEIPGVGHTIDPSLYADALKKLISDNRMQRDAAPQNQHSEMHRMREMRPSVHQEQSRDP